MKKERSLNCLNIVFLILLILIVFLIFYQNYDKIFYKNVRQPLFAGSWYPSDKNELNKMLDSFFAVAKKENFGDLKAIIVPHAGYIYSGQVAAKGFDQLNKKYKKVVIIGSNHNEKSPFFKISVSNFTYFKTPLGEVKVSSFTNKLLRNNLFSNTLEPQEGHMIEVELPFLQKKLSNFEILPLVTGELNEDEIKLVAKSLDNYIDNNTLIVISSDLSHYYTYEEAVRIDSECIKQIASQEKRLDECEACGLIGIKILLEISRQKRWSSKIIDYKNSGDTSGEKSRVVGYSSIIFFNGKTNQLEEEFLLNLSRESIKHFFKTNKKIEVNEDNIPKSLLEKKGCFVTLNKNGALRGCVGHIIAQEALYQCVIDNSLNAAFNDGRFNSLDESELTNVDIKISVLSTPQKLVYSDFNDLLKKIPQDKGIILTSFNSQATFLPEVWEQMPQKEVFLSQLCLKAALNVDCWKSPLTQIQTYETTSFGEN